MWSCECQLWTVAKADAGTSSRHSSDSYLLSTRTSMATSIILGFLHRFSFTSLFQKSLEWHLSWLGNEPCFLEVWKCRVTIYVESAFYCFLCWQIKSRGVGPPQGSLFYSEKGCGALGPQPALQKPETQEVMIDPTEGAVVVCGLENCPEKEANCNRKEKKRQNCCFVAIKEGGESCSSLAY